MEDSPNYETRVAEGRGAYQRLTGRTVSADQLDRARDEVRQMYRRFGRRLPAPHLGANEGEWIALRLGLKPMVREVVDEAHLQERIRVHRERDLEVVPLKLRASQDPIDGYTVSRSCLEQLNTVVPEGEHPWREMLNRSHAKRAVIFVGRERDALHEAAELDRRLLEGDEGEREAALTEALGRALGYPECCVRAWVSALPIFSNRQAISAAAQQTKVFVPLLNNLSLSTFHHIGWTPCAFDCEPSRRVAARVDDWIRDHSIDDRHRVWRMISMPRIYFDDRRQLIFDGYPQPSEPLHYRAVYSPYALDGQAETAAMEWVFWVDVVQRFARGDNLVPLDDGWLIRKGEVELERFTPDDPGEWLPFASLTHRVAAAPAER